MIILKRLKPSINGLLLSITHLRNLPQLFHARACSTDVAHMTARWQEYYTAMGRDTSQSIWAEEEH